MLMLVAVGGVRAGSVRPHIFLLTAHWIVSTIGPRCLEHHSSNREDRAKNPRAAKAALVVSGGKH